jgi:hypothetical protein
MPPGGVRRPHAVASQNLAPNLSFEKMPEGETLCEMTCTSDTFERMLPLHIVARFADTKTTFDTYRKETERLLLWAVVQQGKSLSSITHEDLLGSAAGYLPADANQVAMIRHGVPLPVRCRRPASASPWPFSTRCSPG